MNYANALFAAHTTTPLAFLHLRIIASVMYVAVFLVIRFICYGRRLDANIQMGR